MAAPALFELGAHLGVDSAAGASQTADQRWAGLHLNPTMWWNYRQICEEQSIQGISKVPAFGNPCRTVTEQTIVSRLIADLKQCTKARDLEYGKKLHSNAVEAGIHSNRNVARVLIAMYSRCRSMALAQQVFDEVVDPDAVTWSFLIQGYAQNGESSKAMSLFATMDCETHFHTYVAVLKACGALASQSESGKQIYLNKGIAIHKQLKQHGFGSERTVAATLVDMYSKCGSMDRARQVFDSMVCKDVVAWNILILGYVQNRESLLALNLFDDMDCEPVELTFVAALKACSALAYEKKSQKEFCLRKGIQIHERAADCGFESSSIVANSLVDMYTKCGSMVLARKVFDSIKEKNVVTWNILIRGYIQNGESLVAMDLFSTYIDCRPDLLTYVTALQACARLASEKNTEKSIWLEKGMAIHKQAQDQGFTSYLVIGNVLVDMYSKCGSTDGAREVFNRMVCKNIVTWNSLLFGYLQNGKNAAAMKLFTSVDCKPDHLTYVAALKACGALACEEESQKATCLDKGIEVHKQVRKQGFESNIAVANTLVDMYSKCGSMDRARQVFDTMNDKDVVTWNALMLGYVQNGESTVAMDLFTSIDCEPDSLTYIAGLKACGSLADSHKQIWLEKGIAIHEEARKRGVDFEISVATTLVDMYGKCGSMDRAREVFDGMASKAVATWNALILGYVRNGESLVALDIFSSMGYERDYITYVAALKACGCLASLSIEEESNKQRCLERGIAIHNETKDRRLDGNILVANILVDMYSKCGSMDRSREVFDRMVNKNTVSWNSLILGYVQNKESSKAVEWFTTMDCEPDLLTYVAALMAYGNLGLLHAGRQIHAKVCRLGLEQDEEVANTLIDFYGNCSSMNRAEEVFINIQAPNTVLWSTLTGGYSSSGNPSQVFSLVKKMQAAGCEMDGFTFLFVLTACSHAGLLEEASICFEAMVHSGIKPSVEHYNCMVDLLGRANRLQEAVSLAKSLPFGANPVVWNTLLGASSKWANPEVGKVALNALVPDNPTKSLEECGANECGSYNIHEEHDHGLRENKNEDHEGKQQRRSHHCKLVS